MIFKLICLSLLIVCCSCSSDEPSEYTVTVEVSASSDDVAVWIHGIGEHNGQGVYFQRSIKRTFVTRFASAQIIIRCEDPKVLLTVKIWVNNKLATDIVGNSYIDTGNYISKDKHTELALAK